MTFEYSRYTKLEGSYHYLVVAKLRKTMAVSKQAAQNFDGERYNGRKLSELEVRKRIRLRSQTGLQLLRT
jgi:hypothetical protein